MRPSSDREQIVEVALRRFGSDGYRALSMRGLAEEVGVTAPALYRHFGSKEEILGAVVRRGFERFTASLAHALTAPTPRERLRAAGAAILDFALDEPRLYQVLAYPGDEPEVRQAVEHLHVEAKMVWRFLEDRVRECMASGFLKKDDPRKVTLLLWGVSHGLLVSHLSGHLALDREEFRELFWECGDRVVSGLAADRA